MSLARLCDKNLETLMVLGGLLEQERNNTGMGMDQNGRAILDKWHAQLCDLVATSISLLNKALSTDNQRRLPCLKLGHILRIPGHEPQKEIASCRE